VEHLVKLYRFLNDQTGVTGIEYTLIATGIAVGIVAVVSSIGSALIDFFTLVESSVSKGS
jgi:Flp pilus assembly pilin Flp